MHLYGSLTSVAHDLGTACALSPPAARAMFSAARFASVTGLVSERSFGASPRISFGTSRIHSAAGCTSSRASV